MGNRAKLLALIGAGAMSALTAGLTLFEGNVLVGYNDLGGVATACEGVTGPDVVVGKRYTPEQCEEMNAKAALAHAQEVLRCTPRITGNQLAAASMLAYNIGPAAYCRSTVARRFSAGDVKGACDAFRSWKYVNGKVVNGLVRRREYERALCLRGVA